MVKYIFILLLLICISIVYIIKSSVWLEKENYKLFVINYSLSLKKLRKINSKYTFFRTSNNYDESHTYDNEKFYDTISCKDYLIYQLQFNKTNIERDIKFIEKNKDLYESYKKEAEGIFKQGNFSIVNFVLVEKKLLEVEKEIFLDNLRKPQLYFGISVTLYCSKINGEVYKNKKQFFSSNEIINLIRRINNRRNNFYNDREIWESICKVERGKVSNKMRFSIYNRDRYICRMCGMSGRYTDLEIDHIKPIAKGGKSTYDNLQTLCRRCNKYKGDSY